MRKTRSVRGVRSHAKHGNEGNSVPRLRFGLVYGFDCGFPGPSDGGDYGGQ